MSTHNTSTIEQHLEAIERAMEFIETYETNTPDDELDVRDILSGELTDIQSGINRIRTELTAQAKQVEQPKTGIADLDTFLQSTDNRAWMQAQINQAEIDNEELDFTPL